MCNHICHPGEVHVVSPPGLDFEVTAFYVLTFTSTDGNHVVSASVNLTVLDGPEAPVIHNLPATVHVYENVTTSTVLYVINATDFEGDQITYSMSATPDEDNFYLTGAEGDMLVVLSKLFYVVLWAVCLDHKRDDQSSSHMYP